MTIWRPPDDGDDIGLIPDIVYERLIRESARTSALLGWGRRSPAPPPTLRQRLAWRWRALRERVGFWIAGYTPWD